MADSGWTDEEMAGFLSSIFEIGAKASDIKQMHPEFVLNIYSNFVRDFGASLESISQGALDLPEDMQRYPEMYHHVIKCITLAKVVGMWIERFSGDNSFMLADLTRPKPKRTKKFFELLCEAYTGSSECQTQLNVLEEKVEERLESKKDTEDAIRKKKQELQELKKGHAANKIQEQQELLAIEELRHDLDELQSKKMSMKEDVDKIKAAISSLSTQISDIKLEILNKNEYLEKLNRQVVTENEQQEAEQMEHHLNERRKSYNDRYSHLSNLHKVQKNLNHCNETVAPQIKTTLQEIQQEITKAGECCASIADIERKKRIVKEESDDQKNVIMQLSEMVSSCQEMMKKLLHSWSMKEEALKQEIEQLKLVKSELMRNLTEDCIAMQDLDSQIAQTVKDTENITEQRKEIERYITQYYGILMDAADKNNSELKKSIEELTEKVMTLN
ncbi:uncharacterized protein LOC143021225 [Oratosquilla oratoria]|uniref:uncharacterized protein LOC143021225 n=1 Tax=Oratosquilla oratoria TaxID=337810 RepID=UPI003F7641D8